MVEYQGQIISTGGSNEEGDYTSSVWSFDSHNEFTLTKLPNMTYGRSQHACGIVHSMHHEQRPLLVVAGSYGGFGDDNSEFLDFTVPGSQWQLFSKSYGWGQGHYFGGNL